MQQIKKLSATRNSDTRTVTSMTKSHFFSRNECTQTEELKNRVILSPINLKQKRGKYPETWKNYILPEFRGEETPEVTSRRKSISVTTHCSMISSRRCPNDNIDFSLIRTHHNEEDYCYPTFASGAQTSRPPNRMLEQENEYLKEEVEYLRQKFTNTLIKKYRPGQKELFD